MGEARNDTTGKADQLPGMEKALKLLNAIVFAYQEEGEFPDACDEDGKFTSNSDLFHQVIGAFQWLRDSKHLWDYRLGPIIDIIEMWRKRETNAGGKMASNLDEIAEILDCPRNEVITKVLLLKEDDEEKEYKIKDLEARLATT